MKQMSNPFVNNKRNIILERGDLFNMDISFFWFAVGLGLMGYFIGDGLKHFNRPKQSSKDYSLLKGEDLPLWLSLSKEEVRDLIEKYPNLPKIELNGTTYYNYQKLLDWLASDEPYRK